MLFNGPKYSSKKIIPRIAAERLLLLILAMYREDKIEWEISRKTNCV